MPAISAYASSKLILLGEHAVVYGEPAIAIPFFGLKMRAMIEPLIGSPSGTIHIFAPSLGLNHDLQNLSEDNLVAKSIILTLASLGIVQNPTCKISIFADVPLSSGLGGSAAIAIVIMRALSAFLGHPLKQDMLNHLAFQTETLMHGTPSGIDNTVIVYEKPIYFVKGKEVEFITPAGPFTFLVADSGVKKSTASTVQQVANNRQTDSDYYNTLIRQIGDCSRRGKSALEEGNAVSLGEVLNEDQSLLEQMNLSCPELDNLINHAKQAGALGAKLTGGGKGGHMLTLVEESDIENVRSALWEAGATQVYQAKLSASEKHA
ncbi:MAG: mevalonate kinase [Anaerolineaceae bacterium]